MFHLGGGFPLSLGAVPLFSHWLSSARTGKGWQSGLRGRLDALLFRGRTSLGLRRRLRRCLVRCLQTRRLGRLFRYLFRRSSGKNVAALPFQFVNRSIKQPPELVEKLVTVHKAARINPLHPIVIRLHAKQITPGITPLVPNYPLQ